MKVKDGFMCRMVAGRYVVVAVNEQSLSFNRVIALNGTAHFIWEQLENGTTEEELLSAILQKYEIDESSAKADLKNIIDTLEKVGCIER